MNGFESNYRARQPRSARKSQAVRLVCRFWLGSGWMEVPGPELGTARGEVSGGEDNHISLGHPHVCAFGELGGNVPGVMLRAWSFAGSREAGCWGVILDVEVNASPGPEAEGSC